VVSAQWTEVAIPLAAGEVAACNRARRGSPIPRIEIPHRDACVDRRDHLSAVGAQQLAAVAEQRRVFSYRDTVSSRAVRLGDSVYSMRADGSHVALLTHDRYPNSSFGSVYSPNGNQIAFSSDRNYTDGCCVDLFVMNADGSHERQVPIGALHGVSQIAWVPSPPATATTATPASLPAVTDHAAAATTLRSLCAGGYVSGPRKWWTQSARSGATICATRAS
jgi:hypothetical protein